MFRFVLPPVAVGRRPTVCRTIAALLGGLLLSAASQAAAGDPVALRAENFLVLPTHSPLAQVTIQNLGQTPYQGTLSLKMPENWRIVPSQREVALGPSEIKRVSFNVERATDSPDNSYPVEVTAVGAGATVTRKQNVVCASAPYFKPTIDGNPDEWKDSVPVTWTTHGKKTVLSTYWNRNQLALLVAVEEDRLVPYREGSAGPFDAVQVAVAPQGSRTGTTPEDAASRYEFLFVATGETGQGKCFLLAEPEMKLGTLEAPRKLAPLAYDKAEVFVRRTGTTTYYECAIPFRLIRQQIPPSEGREFCLSVLVHDPEGAGVRDWGEAAGLWPSQRNRRAWSLWEGAVWGKEPPFDNKVEWGLCASKY